MKYEKSEITNTITDMLDQAIQACDDDQELRVKTLQYYDGQVPDLPTSIGRSAVVSKDVRATIIKLMPSVMRTFFGSDVFAKFIPVAPEDEPGDKQATQYFNRVTMTESDVEKAVHGAIFDALAHGTGILKSFIDEREEVKFYSYTDLSDSQFFQLINEEGMEIVEHTEHEETDQYVLEIFEDARRHDCKLRKTMKKNVPELACVAPENFLMTPGYDCIEKAPLTGDRQRVTRSDLVARGYDREMVADLAAFEPSSNSSAEDDARNMGFLRTTSDLDGVNEEVEIYELYVRLDLDDDGIAEMHRVVMAADIADHNSILEIEEFDDAPYHAVTAELEAHQFKGHSLFEDTDDVQRVKTALMRAILDNIYWQNEQQPMFDPNAVEDVDALYNPEFRKPIKLKPGANAQQAVQFRQVPALGADAFNLMNYMDEVAKERTGVTDASGGLDPDQLSKMTATATNLANTVGTAQAEMKIRTMARGGIRQAYRALHRLSVQHQDRSRTVLIKGEWVDFDPRTWNSEMDCVVNIGMGAGSRERDLQALMMILAQQKEIIAAYGVDSPILKPAQIYNTLAQIVEAAGLPSAEPYFTEPNQGEVEEAMAKKAAEPSPEEKKMQMQGQMEAQKLQGQLQIAQQKVQGQMQIEQARLQSRAQIEQEQMHADMQVRAQDQALDTEARAQELEIADLHNQEKLAVEREKIDAEILIHREKLAHQAATAALGVAQQQRDAYHV